MGEFYMHRAGVSNRKAGVIHMAVGDNFRYKYFMRKNGDPENHVCGLPVGLIVMK